MDRWTERLSDHLDGGLAPGETEALLRHLDECDECRRTLEDLRRVRARAGALVDPTAPDDLWAGIARQIGAAGSTSPPAPVLRLPVRRRDFPLPQLVAAGFAALLVGAATLWSVRPATETGRTPATPPVSAPAEIGLASFDADKVEGEITELRAALERGRGKLDPRTIAVLETNLALIQKATDDAKRALAEDPANAELNEYFASHLQSKLSLVRRATQMAGV